MSNYIFQKLIIYDEFLSYNLFKKVPKTKRWKSLLKSFENLCHGVLWLSITIILAYLYEYHIYYKLLTGLILDIIYVSIIKAYFRRKRPAYTYQNDQVMMILSDINSYPSGHASRAFYLAFFFTNYLDNIFILGIVWIWSICVCFSRVLLGRHYLLDIVSGMFLGYFEFLIQERLAFIFSLSLFSNFYSKNDFDDAELNLN